jgi:GNAT superfamily N-acetyltransferase
MVGNHDTAGKREPCHNCWSMELGPEIAPTERLSIRPATFEDGGPLLRLIQAALDEGCREAYSPDQRRAVFLTYAETLFVDLVQPLDTLVAENASGLVGMAQLDPAASRLRALFVDGPMQGRGLGKVLLDCVERIAEARGVARLHGAMSLNAVPFYTSNGYRPCSGADRLVRSGVTVPVAPMEKALRPGGRKRRPPQLE